MPIEPVKIPQNVYVEDRIIGPITLRHLIICGLGGGISYALYSTAAKAGVMSMPLAVVLWSPALISAAFAFVKINDLSLLNIILLGIEQSSKPSTRYWSPSPGISINFVTSAAPPPAAADAAKRAETVLEVTRNLRRHQDEVSKLADAESVPAVAHTMPGTEAPVAVAAHETEADQTARPVNPARVQASGLQNSRSIDGLSGSLGAFEHVFPQQ